ncbi:YihY/virulence factor BrkB family protein [Streptomyces zingiberis]|uniref:YihY/virulence factor BrkB family protein n=1 Tax=Streptomyces zingiberis TaxID=2053010 RepID=UPI001F0F41FB|nr:YihY/virulence factor BrkB family protein [Streptomyces zingiberis]
MNRLRKLPVVGPAVTRLLRTHAGRAFRRLGEVHWDRLAAAVSFFSFVAVFPLISLGVTITAALLGPAQVRELERQLAEQVPLSAEGLGLSRLVTDAGTVGLVSGTLLLVTGTLWVGSLRECLRAVWRKEEDPGNPVLLRLKDGVVLLGLAALGLCAAGGSAFASSAVGWAADRLGLDEGGVGRVLLLLAGLAIGVLADFLILSYLLTGLPRVRPGRRAVLFAGLIGAVGFELLKLGLSGYLQGVAGKSVYGAFGVPVALLIWINLMARLLLFCAAWTATEGPREAAGAGAPPESLPGEPPAGASVTATELVTEPATEPVPEPAPVAAPPAAAGGGTAVAARAPGAAVPAPAPPASPAPPSPAAAAGDAAAAAPRPAPPAVRP